MIENGECVLDAAFEKRSWSLGDPFDCFHPGAHIAIGDFSTELICLLLILLTPNHCRACRGNEK
jgi:hypothetical protein